MARRFQNQQRSRSTPNRSWARFINAASVTVPANSKVLLGGFTLSVDSVDETVLRTVGVIAVSSDQVAANERQIGAFGLIRVFDAVVAVGVTAIPGPVTDASDDGWFLYVPIAQEFQVHSAVGFQGNFATQYHFDSKAKRVFEEGQQVALMVENAHATQGFDILVVFRMLSMVRGTR